MTTYVVINHAEDGTHNRVFKAKDGAQQYVAGFLNFGVDAFRTFTLGHTYVGDFGNQLVIEERPDGWTAARETALRNAYDARECGTLSKRQKALLETLGW